MASADQGPKLDDVYCTGLFDTDVDLAPLNYGNLLDAMRWESSCPFLFDKKRDSYVAERKDSKQANAASERKIVFRETDNGIEWEGLRVGKVKSGSPASRKGVMIGWTLKAAGVIDRKNKRIEVKRGLDIYKVTESAANKKKSYYFVFANENCSLVVRLLNKHGSKMLNISVKLSDSISSIKRAIQTRYQISAEYASLFVDGRLCQDREALEKTLQTDPSDTRPMGDRLADANVVLDYRPLLDLPTEAITEAVDLVCSPGELPHIKFTDDEGIPRTLVYTGVRARALIWQAWWDYFFVQVAKHQVHEAKTKALQARSNADEEATTTGVSSPNANDKQTSDWMPGDPLKFVSLCGVSPPQLGDFHFTFLERHWENIVMHAALGTRLFFSEVISPDLRSEWLQMVTALEGLDGADVYYNGPVLAGNKRLWGRGIEKGVKLVKNTSRSRFGTLRVLRQPFHAVFQFEDTHEVMVFTSRDYEKLAKLIKDNLNGQPRIKRKARLVLRGLDGTPVTVACHYLIGTRVRREEQKAGTFGFDAVVKGSASQLPRARLDEFPGCPDGGEIRTYLETKQEGEREKKEQGSGSQLLSDGDEGQAKKKKKKKLLANPTALEFMKEDIASKPEYHITVPLADNNKKKKAKRKKKNKKKNRRNEEEDEEEGEENKGKIVRTIPSDADKRADWYIAVKDRFLYDPLHKVVHDLLEQATTSADAKKGVIQVLQQKQATRNERIRQNQERLTVLSNQFWWQVYQNDQLSLLPIEKLKAKLARYDRKLCEELFVMIQGRRQLQATYERLKAMENSLAEAWWFVFWMDLRIHYGDDAPDPLHPDSVVRKVLPKEKIKELLKPINKARKRILEGKMGEDDEFGFAGSTEYEYYLGGQGGEGGGGPNLPGSPGSPLGPGSPTDRVRRSRRQKSAKISLAALAVGMRQFGQEQQTDIRAEKILEVYNKLERHDQLRRFWAKYDRKYILKVDEEAGDSARGSTQAPGQDGKEGAGEEGEADEDGQYVWVERFRNFFGVDGNREEARIVDSVPAYAMPDVIKKELEQARAKALARLCETRIAIEERRERAEKARDEEEKIEPQVRDTFRVIAALARSTPKSAPPMRAQRIGRVRKDGRRRIGIGTKGQQAGGDDVQQKFAQEMKRAEVMAKIEEEQEAAEKKRKRSEQASLSLEEAEETEDSSDEEGAESRSKRLREARKGTRLALEQRAARLVQTRKAKGAAGGGGAAFCYGPRPRDVAREEGISDEEDLDDGFEAMRANRRNRGKNKKKKREDAGGNAQGGAGAAHAVGDLVEVYSTSNRSWLAAVVTRTFPDQTTGTPALYACYLERRGGKYLRESSPMLRKVKDGEEDEQQMSRRERKALESAKEATLDQLRVTPKSVMSLLAFKQRLDGGGVGQQGAARRLGLTNSGELDELQRVTLMRKEVVPVDPRSGHAFRPKEWAALKAQTRGSADISLPFLEIIAFSEDPDLKVDLEEAKDAKDAKSKEPSAFNRTVTRERGMSQQPLTEDEIAARFKSAEATQDARDSIELQVLSAQEAVNPARFQVDGAPSPFATAQSPGKNLLDLPQPAREKKLQLLRQGSNLKGRLRQQIHDQMVNSMRAKSEDGLSPIAPGIRNASGNRSRASIIEDNKLSSDLLSNAIAVLPNSPQENEKNLPREWDQVFDLYDDNKDGKLDIDELGNLLKKEIVGSMLSARFEEILKNVWKLRGDEYGLVTTIEIEKAIVSHKTVVNVQTARGLMSRFQSSNSITLADVAKIVRATLRINPTRLKNVISRWDPDSASRGMLSWPAFKKHVGAHGEYLLAAYIEGLDGTGRGHRRAGSQPDDTKHH